MAESMVRFGMSLPRTLMEKFDAHIQDKHYRNRSEAIRDLIRKELVDVKVSGTENVMGVLHLLYDHSKRELTERLNETQHEHHRHVISSMHVHVDHLNCLEVVLLKGTPAEIQELSSHMLAEVGVKHGKLYLTSVG